MSTTPSSGWPETTCSTDEVPLGGGTPAGGWLTVEQLNCDRFHGVLGAFLGDDCDAALAVTDDWRRGVAAIHAMFRRATGMPVRAGRIEVAWVRFYPLPEEYQDSDCGDWVMSPCDQGDQGSTRVVLARGTESYTPRSSRWR